MPIVKKPLILFTFSLIFSSSIYAADIAFYKSKNSSFSSGQASEYELKRHIISSAQSVIIMEDEFYQFGEQKISKKLLAPTMAKDLALTSGYKDIGRFLVLKETALKEKAHVQAKALTFVPARTLLIPLRYEKGFVEVLFKGRKGFVDISTCISKFDYAFAVYAPHPKTRIKQWHYVKSRLFDQIEIYDHSHIPMATVEGIFANDKMGIITDVHSHLPLWSRVNLKAVKSSPSVVENWNQSYLTGHGLIWWKSTTTQSKNEVQLSIDEILKKEVYSISSHPQEPKKSIIATSEGVFTTQDGQTWTRVEQFKNYRGPVYYYNDNMIFVGSYRSTDQGKTFEQFINVHTISAAIARKLGFTPQAVKIKKIKSSSPLKISIDVDTGYKMLKLQSLIYNQNWEVIRD